MLTSWQILVFAGLNWPSLLFSWFFSDIVTDFFDLLPSCICFHCVTFLVVIFGSFEDMQALIDSVWLFHWFVEYSDRLPRSAVEFGLLAFRDDSHRRTLTDTVISWFRLHSICLFGILADFLDSPRIEFVFIPRCSYLDRQHVSSPTPRRLHLHLHQTTAATTPQLRTLQQHQWMYRCRRTGWQHYPQTTISIDHLRQPQTTCFRLKFPPIASFSLISWIFKTPMAEKLWSSISASGLRGHEFALGCLRGAWRVVDSFLKLMVPGSY